MYFRVIDHYPDLPEDEPPELNECLICLEITTHDNLIPPIDLKTQNTFFKKCRCGGWVHLCCLYEWHEISNSCPICRLSMEKSISKIYIFNNYYGKFILGFIRFCFIFWFLFALSCSYHIYKSYFILKNRNQNDDKCEEITE